MESVSLHEAKAKLSELVRLVETGEQFVITRHGRAVARLLALEEAGPRMPGSGVGTVTYLGEFELSDDELDEILNDDVEPDA